MILGLFTGLIVPGGIERIGRHVGAVLSSYAKERGEICQLLSLNDPIGVHTLEVNGIQFSFEGFNRSKSKFLFAVATLALKVRIAYIGHVNLAPVNFLFRLFHCRLIVATHGVEVWSPMYWWRRLSLRLATKVTAPSTYTAKTLQTNQGLNSESIVVIPWAVDPGFLLNVDDRKGQGPSITSGKVLLTVTRLVSGDQYKGVDMVIRALPLVHEIISDLFYVVMGDGDDRPRLEQIAEDIGLDDRIIFAGTASDNELHRHIQNCDVFVLPSKGEGFGLVYIEAMACGKPVVGARQAGTVDVITEGETGFMVEYGDIPGLAQCLVRLLQDEPLRNRMGEAGKRRVRELYTFSRFKKNLGAVLNGNGD